MFHTSKLSTKLDQQTTGENQDYVALWIDSFLRERKAQNLTKGTIRYYRENLKRFVDYLDSQEIKYISQITPNNIRDFLLLLSEGRGNVVWGTDIRIVAYTYAEYALELLERMRVNDVWTANGLVTDSRPIER